MRIVRIIAWAMFGLSAVLMVGSVWFGFSYAATYGGPQGFGEWMSEIVGVVAVSTWPAAIGWLLLRISRQSTAGAAAPRVGARRLRVHRRKD